jgi:hypothetical protein
MPDYVVGQRVRVKADAQCAYKPCDLRGKVVTVIQNDKPHGEDCIQGGECEWCWMPSSDLEPIPEEVNHD